jgi:multidrug efflux pump subunit AcrA (membrane-fusion protein)
MKTIIGVVLLIAAVGGLYAANKMTRTEDGKSKLHVAKELPITVEASQPARRDIVRTVQAPGDVEAFLEVDISAEVVGKIIEMPVEEGQSVKQGDLLCRLDDAEIKALVASGEAVVARLRAAIIQAEADADKAARDCARQARLSEANATSELELADYQLISTRAKAGLEMRRQELIEAEHRLQSAREDLAKTVIRAPIDGVISQRFAKQGEVVVTGTMNNPGTRIHGGQRHVQDAGALPRGRGRRAPRAARPSRPDLSAIRFAPRHPRACSSRGD